MPAQLIDFTGQRFGRLVVLGLETGNTPSYEKIWWRCQCDCGNTTLSTRGMLQKGKQSCGCLLKERQHGLSETPEYGVWKAMKDRCIREKNPQFKDYGGRGISVCGRWMDSFQNFLADMGPRPSDDLTLERIDNNGNYEPGNCRWATMTEQRRNTSRNVYLVYRGRRVTLMELSEISGLAWMTLKGRLERGMSPEEAAETPIDENYRRNVKK